MDGHDGVVALEGRRPGAGGGATSSSHRRRNGRASSAGRGDWMVLGPAGLEERRHLPHGSMPRATASTPCIAGQPVCRAPVATCSISSPAGRTRAWSSVQASTLPPGSSARSSRAAHRGAGRGVGQGSGVVVREPPPGAGRAGRDRARLPGAGRRASSLADAQGGPAAQRIAGGPGLARRAAGPQRAALRRLPRVGGRGHRGLVCRQGRRRRHGRCVRGLAGVVARARGPGRRCRPDLGTVEYIEDLVRPGRILVVASEEGTGTVAISGEACIRVRGGGRLPFRGHLARPAHGTRPGAVRAASRWRMSWNRGCLATRPSPGPPCRPGRRSRRGAGCRGCSRTRARCRPTGTRLQRGHSLAAERPRQPR